MENDVFFSNSYKYFIPGMGEPGGLPSMGSHRVRQDWCDLAASAAAINSFLCILEGGSFIVWKFTLDKICFKICPCYLFLHFTSNTVIYHLVSIYWIYFKHCSRCKKFFFLRWDIQSMFSWSLWSNGVKKSSVCIQINIQDKFRLWKCFFKKTERIERCG